MPCYLVQLVSVQFKVKHISLLEEAVKSLGWSFALHDSRFVVINSGEIKIDLTNQKAECYSSNLINKLKVAYSTKAIEKVAAKKNWLLKKATNNKMQLKRF